MALITAEARTDLIALFVGMFNAAPGKTNLSAMVASWEAGKTLNQIATDLAAQPEFNDVYPSLMTAEEFANELADNLLPSSTIAGARAWGVNWVITNLNAGATRAHVISEAIKALKINTNPDFDGAEAWMTNKVAVAEYYSVTKLQDSDDLGVLQGVLLTVTTDAATVTAAKASIDGTIINTPDAIFALTSGADALTGSAGNDVINGVFGEAANADNTFNAGDVVDGGFGDDKLKLVATSTTASSAAAAVKNVEIIEILDATAGATFNAILVENAPAINVNNNVAGITTTITNGSQASTYGLVGKGNLTVDFATTSAVTTSDVARVSLTGVGTSSTTRSTVTVSDSNTIDTVNLATSGTNFVSLEAGSAAKTINVTGNGTNTLNVSSGTAVAAIVTIDASTSTGTNTFVMGNTLNTADTVKGGTGADTVDFNATTATLLTPNVSGVETLKADFDAAATLDLSKATGLTTVTLSGSSADATLNKAASTVTTLNVQSATGTPDVNFNYATGGALKMNIGTTATTAANITLDQVNIEKSTSFALSTVGTKVYDIANLNLSGDQSSITVTANADLTFNYIDLDDGEVGAFTVTVGEDVDFSGGLSVDVGDIGSFNFSVGEGSTGDVFLETDEGSIGNVTITGEGQANLVIYASGGSIGDISVDLVGDDASGSYLGAMSSGGSIGDINISVADGANLNANISANSWEFLDSEFDENGTDGNIGNITVSVGNDSYFSGAFDADGGDIGDITIDFYGDDASGAFYFWASHISGDLDDDGDYDYVRGGNIGNISISVTGDGANIDGYAGASGGNIESIDITMGENTSGGMEFYASRGYLSGSEGGNIGPVTLDLADEASFDLSLSFDGVAESVTATVGNNSYLWITVSGGGYSSADYTSLGPVDVTMGDDSSAGIYVQGFSGSVDSITVAAGDSADIDIDLDFVDGDIGAIVVTGGDDDSDLRVELTNIDSFGGIDASAWLGAVNINVAGVTTGTTIQVGADGGSVTGTEGADNIFLGAGADTVVFDATPTAVDVIFNFTGGAAKDVLDVANALNFTKYTADTADTLGNGDITHLTDIAGGQDITTAAGLLAALNAGGEYASIDAGSAAHTYTFVTAASASATTFYVFNAVESADAEFDSVTLIGVVNATNGFSSLVAGNFV